MGMQNITINNKLNVYLFHSKNLGNGPADALMLNPKTFLSQDISHTLLISSAIHCIHIHSYMETTLKI